MLKFVKDRKVIWNYIWRWLFGFHKYNNNNNNNSIRGDDNEIMMNKTTTIDGMKHLVELEAMAICKYEPERLSAAYTLAETKEGTAILNNIIKIAVLPPWVGPSHCASSWMVGNTVDVQLFIKDKYPGAAWSS